MARIFILIGAFLFPMILVPVAFRYGPVGLGIVAMSFMGMSLVLYTKLVLKGGMNPPEKRLFIIGCTMLAGGVLLLLQQMLLSA